MTESEAQIATEPTAELAVKQEDSSPRHEPGQSRPFGSLWLAVFMGFFLLVLFPDVFFKGRVFVFRDFSLFAYPLAHYYRESLLGGHLPLWNPLNNFGLPFLGQWNTMVLYPPCLVYLLFPLASALTFFCLGHLCLAAAGMYALAVRWTGHRLGATVGAIAFAFSGLALNSLMWPNNIAALGWMPWVVLYAERGWEESGRSWLKAVFLGALQMLTGAPEIILFTWIIVAILWLVRWVGQPFGRLPALLRFSGIIMGIAALTAVQLLPFLELLRHSHRDNDFGDERWSMPIWGWANLLVPLYRCYQSLPGIFFQTEQRWTCSYYLGIGVLALALVASLRLRDRLVRTLAILAFLSLVLALGDQGQLLHWVRHAFAQVGFMRFPIKFVVLASFIVPLLAAYAIREFLASPRAPWFLAGGVGLIVLASIGFIVWYAHEHPYSDEKWPETAKNAVTRGTFLIMTLAALFGAGRLQRQRGRLLAGAGLVLLVWLDLITHVPSLNPTVDRSTYGSLLPLHELQPKPEHGQSRLLLSLNAMTTSRTILSDLSENLLCNRLQQLYNCNVLEGFPKADGFYSLYLPPERDVHFSLYRSTNEVRSGLADFLGFSQITDDSEAFHWKRRSTYLPLITAGQRPIFVDENASLTNVLADDFDPRRVVYLALPAKSAVTVTGQSEARVLSSNVTAHRITCEVEAKEASLVVLAQSFYPAWKARVDGAPVSLWRANHAFQALEVPAGRHVVQIVYEDRNFYFGALLSGITLLACGLAWWRAGRRGPHGPNAQKGGETRNGSGWRPTETVHAPVAQA